MNQYYIVWIMRILIVDDDLHAMDSLQQIILNLDPSHDIETCHSSYDALQKIRKNKFDIVITEIYLQGGIQGDQIILNTPKATFKVGMAKSLENPMIRQPFNHFLIKPLTKAMVKETLSMAKYNIEYAYL